MILGYISILQVSCRHRSIACNVWKCFCKIDKLRGVRKEDFGTLGTSQERMMVVSATNGQSAFSVGGSGHVERLGEVVILPTSLGPEETLISDFIHHF